MIESFSTMSTYSSFDVCLTFALRQGMAEPESDVVVLLPVPGINGATGREKVD